jgi:hypothetical protein
MQKTKSKIAIAISIFLMLSMVAPLTLLPNTNAQVTPSPGTVIPTYAQLNVFPNPVGVGQQITLNIFLATPLETSARPNNLTVQVVPPTGANITLGPYIGDTTGGTVAYFTPDQVGNYTFQMFYLGERLGTATSGYGSLINAPSNSLPVTVSVQQEPVVPGSAFPFTPLPTQWWQTPVSAQNSQNWYAITGPWLGLGAKTFASTGAYNRSSFYNPYTEDVSAGHVIWTKPWLIGGVPGGILGGDEVKGHFWSTFQYTPRYAPVCMNGIVYSTWYTFSMAAGAMQGLKAFSLYTGEDLWMINTTNTLRCGMEFYAYTPNDYGTRGPWIWTTGTLPPGDTGGSTPSNNSGTQWNLYDGMTGKYIMSLVNGSSLDLAQDDNGNIIGYFVNSTAGTEIITGNARIGANVISTQTGPHVTAVNLTVAIGATSTFSPGSNTFRAMSTGYLWDKPLPNNISGVTISPSVAIQGITGDELVLTGGLVHGQGVGYETAGWLTFAGMDLWSGELRQATNITYPTAGCFLPYTRTSFMYYAGKMIVINNVNGVCDAFDTRTGQKAWETTCTGENGAPFNIYDVFYMKYNVANGAIVWAGFGGDLWCLNSTTGNLMWYTNTSKLIGSSGLETPYNIWPLWAFLSGCTSNNILYAPIGHEYDAPLFRGSQLLAVNMTDGSLVWSELSTSVESTIIVDGKLVTLNAYDNQLYCFGKGPSVMTVDAPTVGVTTSTPITITGTILDNSPGTSQLLVKSNYGNGLPCVSDASQSLFMEAVYQQQPMYSNMTGVPITISVIDANNNQREIGTTTSDLSGTFALTWTPDISGDFTVIANFKGSNSYYPSSAEAHFFAGETPTHEPIATPVTGLATTNDLLTYLAAGVIAIIIAIAIVGLLILRKK